MPTDRQFDVIPVSDVMKKARLLEDEAPAENALPAEAGPLPMAAEGLSLASEPEDGEK